MEKDVAEAILKQARQLFDILNSIMEKAEKISVEEERVAMKRHIGEAIFACDEHLVRHLVKDFPEFDPFA